MAVRKGAQQPPVMRIPDALLEVDRIGIVGTAGSGKTYTAKSAVERLIALDARVCIVDPLGVWWGLRAGVDGDGGGGLDVTIFGGLHADVTITEADGAALGEVIAENLVQCIVDLSELGSGAARRRFMTHFLEALYDRNRDPLHLVLDEADLWSPQKPLPDQHVLQGKMNEIVRRGRVRGFVPWLISQRPAVIDKDVLSQIDTLIAMKLTSSQDRDALMAWVEGQADREEGRRIRAELPTLQRGIGYLWAPSSGILKLVRFPPIATFDSSRTPKRGEKGTRATLRRLDVGDTADLLQKRRIQAGGKLTGKLDMAGTITPPPAQIEAARAEGYAAGKAAGIAEENDRLKLAWAYAIGEVSKWLRDFTEQVKGVPASDFPAAEPAPPVDIAIDHWGLKHADLVDRVTPTEERVERVERVTPAWAPSGGAASHDGALNGAARILLAVLAAKGEVMTPQHAAVYAGLAPHGGFFNAGVKALRDGGYITPASQGFPGIFANDKGVAYIAEHPVELPRSPAALRQLWSEKLNSPVPEILRTLATMPAIGTKELAARIGKAPHGGYWNAGIKRLRMNNLATVKNGMIHLAGELRDGAWQL